MTANTPARSSYAYALATLCSQIKALMHHPGRSSYDMPALIAASLHMASVADAAAKRLQLVTSYPSGMDESLPANDKENRA